MVPYLKRFPWKLQEHLWQSRGPGLFQGREHHQEPPGGPTARDNIIQKKQHIYRYKCEKLDCDEEYIEISARTFGERLRAHLRAPSPIYDHANTTGHHISVNNFSIVYWKAHSITRIILEAMYIRVNDPSLNRNISKFHLPHIWDKVLLNTPGLHLK